MRLIDADANREDFMERVYDVLSDEPDNIKANLIIDAFDEMPTAYDPDKVVERLEEMSYERLENNGMGGELVVNLDDAIEIVRGDREPEPECEWKLEDAEGNLYATGCENRQLIFEGTPEENGYKYCPYCGRKIKRGGVYGN